VYTDTDGTVFVLSRSVTQTRDMRDTRNTHIIVVGKLKKKKDYPGHQNLDDVIIRGLEL